MLLLLSFVLSLVASDSIILQNDCKRTSEQCFITLEVIKGEPKKDCSIFSTVDRSCTIGTGVDPSVAPPDDEIQVTQTEGGTVISWTGQKVKGNGTEKNTLSAASIWQRIKRQVKGQLVNCTCSPVGRQKRSAESLTGPEKAKNCIGGFRPTSRTMDPPAELPVFKATSIEKCAALCSDKTCDAFASSQEGNSTKCVNLKESDLRDGDGQFVVFERC